MPWQCDENTAYSLEIMSFLVDNEGNVKSSELLLLIGSILWIVFFIAAISHVIWRNCRRNRYTDDSEALFYRHEAITSFTSHPGMATPPTPKAKSLYKTTLPRKDSLLSYNTYDSTILTACSPSPTDDTILASSPSFPGNFFRSFMVPASPPEIGYWD
jgi:hypothetical protein